MLGILLLALAQADPPVDFRRDVRPILSDNCFLCHGPDDKRRKGDLRLDVRGDLYTVREGHAALVPGKPGESELFRRLTTKDADDHMPPAKSGKKLTDRQIALIRRWIEEGARWSDHWAFVPPERPELPGVKREAWVRTPVDRFILARLEREGLGPSDEAGRETLLRRLSLDLTGLPPTAAELDLFRADTRADAYERQVDRLLASPHFGERWARHWLDAARYADSDGFEKDKPREAWFYREWVISAFNRDLGYDRFITEQIAGDLLPGAGQGEVVATGFLRNSMVNEEGGVDPEQFRMEAMFDRMDAIGRSILGLTVQCGQCHSHKFDPLTQEEYYRMFAFLNNSHEACVTVYTPEETQVRAQILRDIRDIEQDLRHREPQWREKLRAWEESVRGGQPDWTITHPSVDDISTGGQKYLSLEDGSFLAQSYAPTKHRVKFTFTTKEEPVTGFRLELLTDPNLPRNGPGRSVKGTAALTEFDVEAGPADGSKPPSKVKIASATADVETPEKPLDPMFDDKSGKKRVTGPVSFAIDGKDETAWGIDNGPGRRNQPRKAVFVLEKPISFKGGALIHVYLKQNHGGWNSDDNQNCNLGRMRISTTSCPDPVVDPLPAAVRAILGIPEDRRSAAQWEAVFSTWRTFVPEWKEANDRIEALWARHPEGSTQLVLKERDSARMTHLLTRGDFLKPDRAVTPGVPAFLNPLPADAPPNRLSFARWMVDRKAPTTARAMVNRVWQSCFGTGLVSTSEDLGSQAETPSHPELLDWLAVEFMDRSWSLKAFLRTLVTSATYRQSSKATVDLLARDPANRLLARGPRFRVEGEVVRDIALAASGLLNPRIGGPSVCPPAPEVLFQPPVSYGPKVWKEEKGEDRYRRALYTFRYRSVPYPALQTFDTPNGDASCVRRSRSNTPLQALTTLNEPLFVECARALAARVIAEGGPTDRERLEWAFRRCTARPPTDKERDLLLGFLARQKDHLAGKEAQLKELSGAGATPEAGAWTAVSRVLLNLDETITKE
ncbi:MAG TPA: PSD1 and planctomycete cytochrome C domain-containing protein [Planctomycetota bacterium]|nr:PSD1 and planctomycete cytochrome C domain-containing protein [Planctomycetota bacterium]